MTSWSQRSCSFDRPVRPRYVIKVPNCALARPVSSRPVENRNMWTRPKCTPWRVVSSQSLLIIYKSFTKWPRYIFESSTSRQIRIRVRGFPSWNLASIRRCPRLIKLRHNCLTVPLSAQNVYSWSCFIFPSLWQWRLLNTWTVVCWIVTKLRLLYFQCWASLIQCSGKSGSTICPGYPQKATNSTHSILPTWHFFDYRDWVFFSLFPPVVRGIPGV